MDKRNQPCKYFQQGICKFGADCAYSHDRSTPPSVHGEARPGRTGYRPTYPNMTLSTSNSRPERSPSDRSRRIGQSVMYDKGNSRSPTRNTSQSLRRGGGTRRKSMDGRTQRREENSGQPQSSASQVTPEQVIVHDLTTVHPQWAFTCYGISTDWSIAGNIIDGVDFSPEELRLQALTEWGITRAIDKYVKDVHDLKEFVDSKRRAVLNNPSAALADAINRATGVRDIHQPGHSQIPPRHNPNPTMHVNLPHSNSALSMQDDQIDSFQLGNVPLKPPF
jgi:hypothetical protein